MDSSPSGSSVSLLWVIANTPCPRENAALTARTLRTAQGEKMVSRFRQLLLGTAALLLLPSLAQAQCAAYVSDQISNDLLRVDLASGSTTLVAAGLADPLDLVINAAGTMAFVVERGSGELSSIDLTSGTINTIATGLGSPYSLALNGAETAAYVTESGSGELSIVDLATGSITLLSRNAIPSASSYDAIRGVLGDLIEDGFTVHLGGVICVENDSADTTTSAGAEAPNPDTEVPFPGEGFFYLIRQHDGVSSGPYGFNQQCGLERLPDTGDCP